MKATYSKRALDAIEDAPPVVRKAFFKQVALLVEPFLSVFARQKVR